MKVIKKILSALIVVILIQSFAFPAFAQQAGTLCGDNPAWSYDPASHTLTISGSGDMDDYSYGYDYDFETWEETFISETPWGSYYDEIKAVVIEGEVTSVGANAFYNFANIESVTLCEGVTSIGSGAFFGCASLESINLPEKLEKIGLEAFSGCASLENVTIPAAVKTIGDFAFNDCDALTSISVEAENEYYDSRNDCNALIETASGRLIKGCKNTVIPEGVVTMDGFAFADCYELEKINIPASVTDIGLYAFSNCRSLSSITVDPENKHYDSRNNCNAIIETSTQILVAGCNNTVIPGSVRVIGNYAFYGRTKLTHITIPVGVQHIGSVAFLNCTSLENVVIPVGVTFVDSMAFYGCTGLKSVSIPVGLRRIESSAFGECPAIEKTYFSGSQADWKYVLKSSGNEALTNHLTYVESCATAGHSFEHGFCVVCGDADPDYEENIPGDLDGDGEVTLKDIKAVKKILLGIVDENDISFSTADLDCDGEVTLKDMKLFKKKLIGE